MPFASIFTVAAILFVIVLIVVAVKIRNNYRRKAQDFGYASMGDYLSAAPRTDAEKRDAVSMALSGLILCLLGLIFPPFLLIGLFPLFYGVRKVSWASMGLGLVDDAEQPSA